MSNRESVSSLKARVGPFDAPLDGGPFRFFPPPLPSRRLLQLQLQTVHLPKGDAKEKTNKKRGGRMRKGRQCWAAGRRQYTRGRGVGSRGGLKYVVVSAAVAAQCAM